MNKKAGLKSNFLTKLLSKVDKLKPWQIAAGTTAVGVPTAMWAAPRIAETLSGEKARREEAPWIYDLVDFLEGDSTPTSSAKPGPYTGPDGATLTPNANGGPGGTSVGDLIAGGVGTAALGAGGYGLYKHLQDDEEEEDLEKESSTSNVNNKEKYWLTKVAGLKDSFLSKLIGKYGPHGVAFLGGGATGAWLHGGNVQDSHTDIIEELKKQLVLKNKGNVAEPNVASTGGDMWSNIASAAGGATLVGGGLYGANRIFGEDEEEDEETGLEEELI